MVRFWGFLFVLTLLIISPSIRAADADMATPPVRSIVAPESPDVQHGFSAMCLDGQSCPWMAHVASDGQADRLQGVRATAYGLNGVATLAGCCVRVAQADDNMGWTSPIRVQDGGSEP